MSDDLLNLRLHAIRYETARIITLEFRDPADQRLPSYDPGSHVDLHLPNGLVRSYSLIDASDDKRYRVSVAREASSRGGSEWIHDRMRVGDLVGVSRPRNNFRLKDHVSQTIMFAGGIGVTPLYAMLQQLEMTGRAWELHYSSRAPADTAFFKHLSKPFASGTVVFYHPEAGGRAIDFSGVIESAPPGSHFYCCGPSPMIGGFLEAASGLPEGAAHVERFSGDVEIAEGGFEVILARTGRRLRVEDGETILSTLISAGLDAPSSCREGVCGACEVPLLQGIGDHRDLVQTPAEMAANKSIFLCCSGAKTPSLTIDF